MILILGAGVLAGMLFPWAVRWPEAWTLPAQEAVTAFFSWLATDASLGLFTVRELTRFIAWLLSWHLEMTEALLFRGIDALGLGPVPWVSVAAGVFILGHWLKDARLGIFCALGAV